MKYKCFYGFYVLDSIVSGVHLLREDLQDERRAEGAYEEEGTQKDQPEERGLRQVLILSPHVTDVGVNDHL